FQAEDGIRDKLVTGVQTCALPILILGGHADDVESVAFSPDGTKVLTGSADQTARLWEVASGLLLIILKGHKDRVESVAFSPDGRSEERRVGKECRSRLGGEH